MSAARIAFFVTRPAQATVRLLERLGDSRPDPGGPRRGRGTAKGDLDPLVERLTDYRAMGGLPGLINPVS
jgi:hypothetical protein